MEFSKSTRGKLRRLSGVAWERELSSSLEDLEKHFKSWRAGDIDAFQLNERIHEFHQGPSRDLWGKYTNILPTLLLGHALADGFVEEEEIPEQAREEINRIARLDEGE